MQVSVNPYEVLIRWIPTTGELSGAHCVEVTVVTYDDGSVATFPGTPKPLDTASTKFTDLIGSALSASQAQVTALQAQVQDLQDQLAAVQSLPE